MTNKELAEAVAIRIWERGFDDKESFMETVAPIITEALDRVRKQAVKDSELQG